MAIQGEMRDSDYHSSTLPRGTFARSIFDNHLVRLSDRGGASQIIGSAWSNVAAEELNQWEGRPVPGNERRFAGSVVEEIHRLDTLPGVASRASKAGLKNPDFVVFGSRDARPVVFAVDAKFSVETARPVQVSAETTEQLFDADARLTSLLPDARPGTTYLDGVFLSPDYVLTDLMFKQKVGHRRLTVAQHDVVLTKSNPRDLFDGMVDASVVDRLVRIDGLPFDVWGSLLAAQYYVRLERAMLGLAQDEKRPLLGDAVDEETSDELRARVEARASGADSAWDVVLDWDRDIESIRRQRQAIHQVIGVPLPNAELRDLTDRLMRKRDPETRPSRNQVRKAVGGRFLADVVSETGTIMPPVADFSAELARVAEAARVVGERYAEGIDQIVDGIIDELASRHARQS